MRVPAAMIPCLCTHASTSVRRLTGIERTCNKPYAWYRCILHNISERALNSCLHERFQTVFLQRLASHYVFDR